MNEIKENNEKLLRNDSIVEDPQSPSNVESNQQQENKELEVKAKPVYRNEITKVDVPKIKKKKDKNPIKQREQNIDNEGKEVGQLKQNEEEEEEKKEEGEGQNQPQPMMESHKNERNQDEDLDELPRKSTNNDQSEDNDLPQNQADFSPVNTTNVHRQTSRLSYTVDPIYSTTPGATRNFTIKNPQPQSDSTIPLWLLYFGMFILALNFIITFLRSYSLSQSLISFNTQFTSPLLTTFIIVSVIIGANFLFKIYNGVFNTNYITIILKAGALYFIFYSILQVTLQIKLYSPLQSNGSYPPTKYFSKDFKIVKDIMSQIQNGRFLLVSGKQLIGKTQALRHYVRTHQCAFYVEIEESINDISFTLSGKSELKFSEWSSQVYHLAKNDLVQDYTSEKCKQIAFIVQNLQNVKTENDLKKLLHFGKKMAEMGNKVIFSESQNTKQILMQHIKLYQQITSNTLKIIGVQQNFQNEELRVHYLNKFDSIKIKKASQTEWNNKEIIWFLNLVGVNFESINCLENQSLQYQAWKQCAFIPIQNKFQTLYQSYPEHQSTCFYKTINKLLSQPWQQKGNSINIDKNVFLSFKWIEQEFLQIDSVCFNTSAIQNSEFLVKRSREENSNYPDSIKQSVRIASPYARIHLMKLLLQLTECRGILHAYSESVTKGMAKGWKLFHPFYRESDKEVSLSNAGNCIMKYLDDKVLKREKSQGEFQQQESFFKKFKDFFKNL